MVIQIKYFYLLKMYKHTDFLYTYTFIQKKSTLKLVRMFGHVAENRSVWVEFTKTNSNGWNVDTHLMV